MKRLTLNNKRMKELTDEISNALAKKDFFQSGKFSILVIDDNINFSRFMFHTLKKDFQSARIEVCNNPQQALNCLVEEKPDIVILDINMPHIDGHKMSRIITSMYEKEVPILFVSADWQARDTAIKNVGHQKVDFIAKPVDKNLLSSKVSDLMRKAV